MEKKFKKIALIMMASYLLACYSKATFAAPLGDRLILTINGIPYSQLQIEGYLDVKESLRDDPTKSQLVASDNWNVALSSFIKDMTLYQEANRTSGFRPNLEVVSKATERSLQAVQSTERFKARFQELGIDSSLIREYVGRILAIENLRRSRNGLLKSKTKAADRNSNSAIDWEDELLKRTLIRWFEHGKTYESISLNSHK